MSVDDEEEDVGCTCTSSYYKEIMTAIDIIRCEFQQTPKMYRMIYLII